MGLFDSKKGAAPPPDGVTLPPTQWVDITTLDPNPWNINEMTVRQMEATRESIREYGFIDPVTCRRVDGRWQIIDGEHRWQAAVEEGLDLVLIQPIDLPDDAQARKLTLVLNQHGEAQRFRLAKELATIVQLLGDRAAPALAYTEEELADLVKLAAVQMPEYDSPPHEPGEEPPEPFVEMQFHLAKSAAEVVEDALSRAMEAGESEDRGVALERICADYLSGPGAPGD